MVHCATLRAAVWVLALVHSSVWQPVTAAALWQGNHSSDFMARILPISDVKNNNNNFQPDEIMSIESVTDSSNMARSIITAEAQAKLTSSPYVLSVRFKDINDSNSQNEIANTTSETLSDNVILPHMRDNRSLFVKTLQRSEEDRSLKTEQLFGVNPYVSNIRYHPTLQAAFLTSNRGIQQLNSSHEQRNKTDFAEYNKLNSLEANKSESEEDQKVDNFESLIHFKEHMKIASTDQQHQLKSIEDDRGNLAIQISKKMFYSVEK